MRLILFINLIFFYQEIVLAQEIKHAERKFTNYEVVLDEKGTSECIDIADIEHLQQINNWKNEQVFAFKDIAEVHFKEWKESAVNDDLIRLNIRTLPDVLCDKRNPQSVKYNTPIVDFLGWRNFNIVYSPKIGHIGWLVRGLMPPEFEKERLWGQVKITPNGKRGDFKYESPYQVAGLKYFKNQNIFLNVPETVADKIYKNHKYIPKGKNFWKNVVSSDLPIQLTEGAKKAGSILTAGFVSIGLTGVCAGMYTTKGETEIPPEIHDDLKPFLNKKRLFYIVFDYEWADNVAYYVHNATAIFGKLLSDKGMDVRVISLPGPEKGADDFIAARGEKEYKKLVKNAESFEAWKKRLHFTPDLKALMEVLFCKMSR